jgi:hypothetical protein
VVLNCTIAFVRDRNNARRRKIKAPSLFALALEKTRNHLHVPTALPQITSSRYPLEIKIYAFIRDTKVNLVVMVIFLWIHSGRVYLACPEREAE